MFQFINHSFLIFIIAQSCVVCHNVDRNKTMTYLQHFGYIKGQNETMTDGIKRFQKYAGLNVTGEMDEQTEEVMAAARCGSETPEDPRTYTQKGSFQGSRWRSKNMTYTIVDYPEYLEVRKVDEVIDRAFKEWSKYTEITFTRVTSNDGKMKIYFSYVPQMKHMDSDIILGTARYPIFGGDIRFSSLRNWTVDNNDDNPNRTNLYHVALHEIGHSLGLLHSSYPNSVMSPFFVYNSDVQLHPNDKKKIRYLYSISVAASIQIKPNSTQMTQHHGLVPSICNLTKFDAIIALAHNELYVFNNDKVWLVDAWTDDVVFSEAHPFSISWWEKLPSNIDAAYVDFDGSIYFFKESLCWKYARREYMEVTNQLVSGYPKQISEVFPGIPNDLDAAMIWQDKDVYFFKGNQYWRFIQEANPPVSKFYPKPISTWGDNIPSDLNAVLYFHEYNEETYFFKDMVYYKYQEHNIPALRSYPRPTAFWWFNC